MWTTLLSAALKTRMALWALDMALPSSPDLQRRYRSGLAGIIAAVAGGVLLAFFVVVALGWASFMLYRVADVSVTQAASMIAAILMITIVSLFFIGKAKISKAFSLEGLSDKNSGECTNPVREILHGFMEGFVAPPAPYEDSEHPAPANETY